MYLLPDTPQPPLRVWKVGVELGLRAFGKLFVFTCVLAILGLLPNVELGLSLGNHTATREALRAALNARWFAIELVCFLLSLLVQAVILVKLDQSVSSPLNVEAAAWRRAARTWPPLLGAVVLCGLIVLFAMLIASIAGGIVAAVAGGGLGRTGAEAVVLALVIIVAVFLAIYLVFVSFAVVLDGGSPFAAINLSFNLVRGHWWRTFTVLLITGVVLTAILLLVSWPVATALGWHAGAQTGRVLIEQDILRAVVTAFVAPFIIAIVYVQYRDLKLRRTAATQHTAAFQA